MSRLSELIDSLCPDGVECKAIGEVCSISAGGDVPRERFSKEKTEIYSVPIISNGVGDKAIQGYTDKPVITQHAVTVSARGTIGYVALRTEAFYPVVRLLCLTPHEGLLAGFLKYAVEIINFIVPKGGIQQLTIPMISKYTIPVPPLEVQAEIVRILDKFTELISLLERELELRRKQYAYYREHLLKFGDDVERKTFGETCTLHARIGWQRLTRKEYLSDGEYMLITGTDFTESHEVNYSTCVYVSEERYNQDERIQLRNDDVLITKDGTLGKVAQVQNLPKPATLNAHLFVVRSKDGSLNQRFIMHYLTSYHFMDVVDKRKTRGIFDSLPQAIFSELLIPIPPLDEQKRIASMLDRFNSLCDAINAEITARRKQYNYYLDKLLTFTEKTS